MKAPAVFVDRHNRTTLVVVVGRKFIGHLPMEAPISLTKTRIATFERDYRPLLKGDRPYPVEKAVEHFTNGTLPITERALRLLKRVTAGPITEDEFLSAETETDMTNENTAAENVTKTVNETENKTKKGRAAKAAEKTPAKGKAAKAEKPAKAAKAEKPAKGKSEKKTGRPTLFQDHQKIKLLVKKNPKREGTLAYQKWEAYENGMTVGAYLAKGIGGRSTLKHDVEHGFIEIR